MKKKFSMAILGILGVCVILFVLVLAVPTSEPAETPTGGVRTKATLEVRVSTEIPPTIAPTEIVLPTAEMLQIKFELQGFTFEDPSIVDELNAIYGEDENGLISLLITSSNDGKLVSVSLMSMYFSELSLEQGERLGEYVVVLLIAIDSPREVVPNWFVDQFDAAWVVYPNDYLNRMTENGILYTFGFFPSVDTLAFVVTFDE